MTIELNDITSGYSTGLINENFQKLETYLNESLLNRDNLSIGEPNHMEVALDMNGNPILNVSVDTSNPGSLLTIAEGDNRYLTEEDGALQADLDAVEAAYQAADANLQSQISGGTPLEASAFSEISWHGQVIENSVTVPENKNAWSFGPTMSVAAGQSVTIGSGSFWTIANGEVQ